MTLQELTAAGIPLAGNDATALLYAEAALDWMQAHTTLEFDASDVDALAALPSCAKLFVVKFTETMRVKSGVASQSIEGLSQSFDTADKAALIWQLANALLGTYIKSQVRVTPAARRW